MKTEKKAPKVKLPKVEENLASEAYLEAMVQTFTQTKKMEVFDMRKNVRVLTIVNFFPGIFHPMRKSRGLWQQDKPHGWPAGVPFCDPNNHWDNPNQPHLPGTKKKPPRDVLAKMMAGLVKVYLEKKQAGTLVLPDAALDLETMPVQSSDMNMEEDVGTGSYVMQGCINPTVDTKAVYGPTEVSGDTDNSQGLLMQSMDEMMMAPIDKLNDMLGEQALQMPTEVTMFNNCMTDESYVQFDVNKLKDEQPATPQPQQVTQHQLADLLQSNLTLRMDDDHTVQQDATQPKIIAQVAEDDATPSQYDATPSQYVTQQMCGLIGEEVNDGSILQEIGLFLSQDLDKVRQMMPVEEQDSALHNAFSQMDLPETAPTQYRHESDLNFNVQTKPNMEDGFTQQPAIQLPMSVPHTSVAPVNNMAVMGVPVGNSGQLVTDNTSPPLMFGGQDGNATSSWTSQPMEEIVITNDEDEQIFTLANGQRIKIVRKKKVAPPPVVQQPVQVQQVQQPITTDLLSQAMQSIQVQQSMTPRTMTPRTVTPRTMAPSPVYQPAPVPQPRRTVQLQYSQPRSRQVAMEKGSRMVVGQIGEPIKRIRPVVMETSKAPPTQGNPLAQGLPADYVTLPPYSPPARMPVEETGDGLDIGGEQTIPLTVESYCVEEDLLMG